MEFSPFNSGVELGSGRNLNSDFRNGSAIHRDSELSRQDYESNLKDRSSKKNGYQPIKSDLRFRRSSSKFNIGDSRYKLNEDQISNRNNNLDFDISEPDEPAQANQRRNQNRKQKSKKKSKKVKKEFFGDEYIENPQAHPKKQKKPKKRAISLTHLVDGFFQNEYVEDFKCGHCKEQVMIKKFNKIIRLPKILVVSLKRFVFYPKMKKINRPIFLGKNTLQLEKHILDPKSLPRGFGHNYEFLKSKNNFFYNNIKFFIFMKNIF